MFYFGYLQISLSLCHNILEIMPTIGNMSCIMTWKAIFMVSCHVWAEGQGHFCLCISMVTRTIKRKTLVGMYTWGMEEMEFCVLDCNTCETLVIRSFPWQWFGCRAKIINYHNRDCSFFTLLCCAQDELLWSPFVCQILYLTGVHFLFSILPKAFGSIMKMTL